MQIKLIKNSCWLTFRLISKGLGYYNKVSRVASLSCLLFLLISENAVARNSYFTSNFSNTSWKTILFQTVKKADMPQRQPNKAWITILAAQLEYSC